MFWSFRFCITLELSGPRQRLRLNDLLCQPLTFNLAWPLFWCFDLDCTELAEHHCPVCTTHTTDFKPTKTWYFWNRKEPTTIWSRQIDITTNFTCLKNNPLKLPPKRTTHEIEFSLNQEPTDLGFHVLNFSVLHNAGVKRLRVARSAWMTCYTRPWFWPWTFVLTFLAPIQQNITARFARRPILIFWNQLKSALAKPETQLGIQQQRRNRQNEITTIFSALKTPTEIITKKNNPSIWILINQEASYPGFRVLTLWFRITLALSGCA